VFQKYPKRNISNTTTNQRIGIIIDNNIFDFIQEARHQQDNEQWHLLIIEELTQKKGVQENFWLYRVLP
jgi:hypothetical protein